jgi:hypothetical protein
LYVRAATSLDPAQDALRATCLAKRSDEFSALGRREGVSLPERRDEELRDLVQPEPSLRIQLDEGQLVRSSIVVHAPAGHTTNGQDQPTALVEAQGRGRGSCSPCELADRQDACSHGQTLRAGRAHVEALR